MAPTNHAPQDLALQARLSVHVRRIATELYRFDRRSESATLDELTPVHQQTYLHAATAAAYLSDQERLRPALYDAADQLVPGGIGTLTRPQRAQVVKACIRAIQVMRQHLCGQRHPDTVDLMRTLSTNDASASQAQAAAGRHGVSGDTPVDLTAVPTPDGAVM